VESFIPLWEWDLPRKRSRKKNERVDSKKKGKESETVRAEAGRLSKRWTIPVIQGLKQKSIMVEETADDDE